MSYGRVYCMTNESLSGLCKLGHIHVPDKLSQKRAKELSNTSIPTDYKVEFDIKVKNASKYEKIIHNKLKDIRFKENKEFFKCNPEDIMKYFKLENLITCEEDKYDFPYDYFTIYNNRMSNDKIKNNVENTATAKTTETNINNITDFECKLCKYMTAYLSNYKRHCTSTNHLTNEQNMKFCVLCNTKYNNINSYNTHRYNFHNNKKSTEIYLDNNN